MSGASAPSPSGVCHGGLMNQSRRDAPTRRRFRTGVWIGIVLTLLGSAPSWGESDPADAPLEIQADRLRLDRPAGRVEYLGSVRLQRGRLSLEAAEVSVRMVQEEVTQIQAIGQPVRMRRAATAEEPALHAQAQRVEYDPRTEVVTLRGQARLRRGNTRFEAERIRYRIAADEIEADGGETGERVRMRLDPANLPKETP